MADLDRQMRKGGGGGGGLQKNFCGPSGISLV